MEKQTKENKKKLNKQETEQKKIELTKELEEKNKELDKLKRETEENIIKKFIINSEGDNFNESEDALEEDEEEMMATKTIKRKITNEEKTALKTSFVKSILNSIFISSNDDSEENLEYEKVFDNLMELVTNPVINEIFSENLEESERTISDKLKKNIIDIINNPVTILIWSNTEIYNKICEMIENVNKGFCDAQKELEKQPDKEKKNSFTRYIGKESIILKKYCSDIAKSLVYKAYLNSIIGKVLGKLVANKHLKDLEDKMKEEIDLNLGNLKDFKKKNIKKNVDFLMTKITDTFFTISDEILEEKKNNSKKNEEQSNSLNFLSESLKLGNYLNLDNGIKKMDMTLGFTEEETKSLIIAALVEQGNILEFLRGIIKNKSTLKIFELIKKIKKIKLELKEIVLDLKIKVIEGREELIVEASYGSKFTYDKIESSNKEKGLLNLLIKEKDEESSSDESEDDTQEDNSENEIKKEKKAQEKTIQPSKK